MEKNMYLEGSYEFQSKRQLVWDMLLNPEVIGSIIPGANGLEEIGENKYQSTIVVKVGPVHGRFEANIELADIQPVDSYKLLLSGTSPVGYVSGEGRVRLEETDGVTKMFYSGNAVVGGKIAAVGQRLLDLAAKTIAQQGLNALAQKVEARIAQENAAAE
jgi:carbon monoxide dehydrogenase subunit G